MRRTIEHLALITWDSRRMSTSSAKPFRRGTSTYLYYGLTIHFCSESCCYNFFLFLMAFSPQSSSRDGYTRQIHSSFLNTSFTSITPNYPIILTLSLHLLSPYNLLLILIGTLQSLFISAAFPWGVTFV